MIETTKFEPSRDDSFESIFGYYYSGLHVYARKFVVDNSVASDILHDVFVNLWQIRDKLEPSGVKSYLFNSVRNECISHLRHLKVKNEYQKRILSKGDLPEDITWEYYVKEELQLRIASAIESLTTRQRHIFEMSRYEGMSAQDIAQQLDISARTVEKHLEMSLKSMRKSLADYLPLLVLLIFRLG